MTTPSASKAGYAFATVRKLTPSVDARLRADGSQSPSLARPRAISSSTGSRIWDLVVDRPGVLVDCCDEHTEVYALDRACIT
jgi:hypothetical protein